MAKIPGSVPVAGVIAPTDSNDVFAVTDPKYQKGGYRVVATVDEMNKITTQRREEGMLVYVLQDNSQEPAKATTYRLVNGNFVKEEIDLSGLDSMITQDELTEILNDYYTKTEAEDKFLTLEKVNELVKDFVTQDDLSNYVSKPELSNAVAELEDKITQNRQEVDTILNDHEDRITGLEEGKGLNLDEEMLEVDAKGRLTVKPPTETTKGVVKIDNDTVWLEEQVLKVKKYVGDGTGIEIMENGTVKFTKEFNDLIAEIQARLDGEYEPPTNIGVATPYKVGLVKPDNTTISVDKNGTISSKLTVDLATPAKPGIVKPDGDTIQVSSTGTISIRNPIKKLEQIENVKAGNINNKKGQYLRVAEDGKSWEVARIGEASNRSFEFDIDSETEWTEVYNLRKHINVSIAAQLECKASAGKEFDIKFVATSGSEVIEHVNPTMQMYIPNREFHVTIFAKGKGKILLDILLVF